MDYILQIEKLFKFFELNLDLADMAYVIDLKRKFNNDLNLFGCFMKDFLTIKNSYNLPDDEEIYNEFVIYFEQYRSIVGENEILTQLSSYADYYLMLVFENVDSFGEIKEEVLYNLSTINSCSAIDTYSFLMETFDDYFNDRISGKSLLLMLESTVDIVLERIESPERFDMNFVNIGIKINEMLLNSLNISERQAI